MVYVHLNFEETINFSKAVIHFTFSSVVNENPVASHLYQHLVWLVFLNLVILIGVYGYYLVFSIYISLATNDVEYLFHVLMCLLYTSFGKGSVQIFGPLFSEVLHFLVIAFCKCFKYSAYKSFIRYRFVHISSQCVICFSFF